MKASFDIRGIALSGSAEDQRFLALGGNRRVGVGLAASLRTGLAYATAGALVTRAPRRGRSPHRVRVAVSTLRKMGLRDVLRTEEAGYRIDPAYDVQRSE